MEREEIFAMAKSPEEGEVEEELDIEARAKRRKSWQKIVDGHVKMEGGCVKIFLWGTSQELVIYDSPPEPLLRHVLEELSILQGCPGGVILERGTRKSFRLHTILPIGEFDFIPAPSSGYIDSNRLLHRDTPRLSPNTFLACNAFIYNDHMPIWRAIPEGESVLVKRFYAELVVDSGCHMELVIPKRKARQLGLEECGKRIIQGYGGANIVMQIYRDVLVCLVKDGKTFKRGVLVPASKFDEEDEMFAGLRDVKNIENVDMCEFEDQSIEDFPLPLKVVQFSPHKNKPREVPEVPDAILGLRGLEKMQITIDFEKALLIPMCCVGYISTTIELSATTFEEQL